MRTQIWFQPLTQHSTQSVVVVALITLNWLVGCILGRSFGLVVALGLFGSRGVVATLWQQPPGTVRARAQVRQRSGGGAALPYLRPSLSERQTSERVAKMRHISWAAIKLQRDASG